MYSENGNNVKLLNNKIQWNPRPELAPQTFRCLHEVCSKFFHVENATFAKKKSVAKL